MHGGLPEISPEISGFIRGADAPVTYCGGCLYLLRAARELFGYNIPIFHSMELVRYA